ncbi:Mob1/phocein [Myriangium duriaei CBS 260.36]|uniref:Mob1/phocein n=1 Tax=Myriangium duriaei CBS 260.36 TaxID=1168546 RepID=A0A9P4MG80_9PEZI|nr:Mob1/phocein [Myriangium duriaei CBS 260.36]
MAEDQVGPTSPGALGLEDLDKIGQAATLDQGAGRRIRPGTKAEDMHEGPPLIDPIDIDSAFQLTEHLKALFAHLTSSPDSTTSTPITRSTALQLSTPPPGVDRGIWLYELCRLLVARANTILISLFSDSPACSAATCPEMRASEWQYLCAAHDPPKSCCAIDYCCHTLDWSATQLTSSKLFPSRLALGTENVSSAQQLRKMTEIFRRVYRIFAHAWFQHRDVFWRVEGRTGLYVFFKTVCDEFRLIPEDSYTVPAEAEGGVEGEEGDEGQQPVEREEKRGLLEDEDEEAMSGKDTQKRHHRTMAERQNSVSTVIHEEVEEDDEDVETEEPVGRGAVEELLPSDDGPVMPQTEGEEITLQHSPNQIEAADKLFVQKEVTVDASPAEEEGGESTVEPKTETVITASSEAEESEPVPAPEEPSSTTETKEEAPPKEEPMNPQTSAAGEAEDATKTVAD